MDERKSSGIGIHARRVLAYIVLIFISILCLFWFYVLFVNATRSHAQIQLGILCFTEWRVYEQLGTFDAQFTAGLEWLV